MAVNSEVLERLEHSAAWRQAEEEVRAELVAKRTAAASRIEEAEAAFRKAEPKLRKAVEAARAKHDKLGEQLKEAEAALGTAERDLADASAMVATIREREHAYLRRTAPGLIAAFREELEGEFERHRNEGVASTGGGFNYIEGHVVPPTHSDGPSRQAWAGAVMEALRACVNTLPLVADPSDIEAEIERIRESIPDRRKMVRLDEEEAA